MSIDGVDLEKAKQDPNLAEAFEEDEKKIDEEIERQFGRIKTHFENALQFSKEQALKELKQLYESDDIYYQKIQLQENKLAIEDLQKQIRQIFQISHSVPESGRIEQGEVTSNSIQFVIKMPENSQGRGMMYKYVESGGDLDQQKGVHIDNYMGTTINSLKPDTTYQIMAKYRLFINLSWMFAWSPYSEPMEITTKSK
eukprot:6389_1